MRLRHLAAALLGFGLLAAGYTTLSQSDSQPVLIDLNDGTIQVSATVAGLGAWVPYTITVRNLGEQRFEGDLLLVNRANGRTPSSGGSRGPFGLPAQMLGPLSQGERSAAPPDSAYRFHLLLDGRHKRVVTLTAPGQFGEAEVHDGAGRLVAEVPVSDRNAIAVGVLSDTSAVSDSLAAVRFGDLVVRPIGFDANRPLPRTAIGYAGLVALVLDRKDTRALSPDQARALRQFVGFGGTLVLAGAGGLEATSGGIPADLLPLAPTGVGMTSLQPLADLAARPSAPAVAIATGTAARSARVLLGNPATAPLALELAYGSGRVVELLFDPIEAATVRAGLDGIAWSSAIGRGLERLPGNLPVAATLLEAGAIPAQLLPSPADAPLPRSALVLALGAIYVLVVGPATFVALRRARRPTLFWAAAPALAVVFSLGAYVAGQFLQGGIRDQQVEFMKLGPAGSLSTLTYHGISFPLRGQHQVTLPAGSLGVPLTVGYPALELSCPSCTFRVGGVRAGAHEHLRPAAAPVISETGVVYGSVRVVGEAATTSLPLQLEVHLAAVNDGLQGTITNRGLMPLRNVRVYAYVADAVRWAPVLDVLPPGATTTIDLKLSRVNDFIAPSRGRVVLSPGVASGLVADGAAQSVLSHQGEIAVVGLVEGPPSALSVDGIAPSRSVRAAVAATFALDSARGRLGIWTSARLNSTLPQTAGSPSLLDTYDLEVPAVSELPVFRYDDRVYSEVEVYDWSSGGWRSKGFVDDSLSPLVKLTQLLPGELRDGRVRVRVRESTITWGRDLVLRFADETP